MDNGVRVGNEQVNYASQPMRKEEIYRGLDRIDDKEWKSYWKIFLGKTTIYEATYYFVDVIENPQVNNIEKRMEYANAIGIWH